MAWPPNTGFTQRGSTPATVSWGTEGVYSGVIVKSVRAHQMIEEIKIENGTGLTAMQILLNDGVQIDITVIDDRSLTIPAAAATLTLISPLDNSPGAGAQNTATTLLQVVDNDYNAATKQPGERVLVCKKYTLITPS